MTAWDGGSSYHQNSLNYFWWTLLTVCSLFKNLGAFFVSATISPFSEMIKFSFHKSEGGFQQQILLKDDREGKTMTKSSSDLSFKHIKLKKN